MEKWLNWAIEIQSLAQAGLAYTNNVYDIERYERLREISAEIISEKSDLSLEKTKDLFCNETGYQTPKIDTRAAIFKDDKILLVHENNGTWSLPGGWCDVLESVKSNTVKEVREETGLELVNYQFRGIVTFISDKWEDEYMCLYTADKYIGEIGVCDEGELVWVEKDKIKDLNILNQENNF